MQLQNFYAKYEKHGLSVAAFPCNQFGKQEPWFEGQIKEFLVKQFGVTFDMYSKVDVNGPQAHPLWKYLRLKTCKGEDLRWNFSKMIVDRAGLPVKAFPPEVLPKQFETEITTLLFKK